MSFLDDLMEKAEQFGDKVREGLAAGDEDPAAAEPDSFDGEGAEPAPTEAAGDAVAHSPEAVERASLGIEEAIAEARVAAEAPTPAADPLDAPVEPVETVDPAPEPAEPRAAEDPLES